MLHRVSCLALRARHRFARRLLALAVAAAAAGAGACGEQDIQLAKSDPNYEGAKIFQQSCSGCHTIEAAGTQGSAPNANDREYVDGPNFEAREETVEQVLYAIRNGGFSSGPMPQDIVVGEEAEKVARFVAEYSGGETTEPQRTDMP
jgi:mono/diheme cytochrome c family protein